MVKDKFLFLTCFCRSRYIIIHSFDDLFLLVFFRRLYAYPKGDNCDYLSLYLEVVDWKSLPSGWRRFVKLRLSVVKQSYDIDSVMKGDSCHFV